jgi:hypothetical protein
MLLRALTHPRRKPEFDASENTIRAMAEFVTRPAQKMRGRNRTRTGFGIEPDQNKPCQVPQRPFIGLDFLALQRATMDCLCLARTPRDPQQIRRLLAYQPSIAEHALSGKAG